MGLGGGGGVLAISVFWGICSWIGRWSELSSMLIFVVELYWLLLRVLIKKPSIRLCCV